MPYLPPNLQKRQQQVAAPSLGGSAPSAAVSAGPASPAAPAPVNTGSGWTNLQDYLSANSAPLQAEATRVGQEITPKAEATITPQDTGSLAIPWLDVGGKYEPSPGSFGPGGTQTASPLFTDQQRQNARDLQFEFKNQRSEPGLDQWLRNSSGVTDAWDKAYGKYGDAINTVANYQWNKPEAPPPDTGEPPPPVDIPGPFAGLPTVGKPPDDPGNSLPGGGPATQGVPGGMFGFDPPKTAPTVPQATPISKPGTRTPEKPQAKPTIGEGYTDVPGYRQTDRRNLLAWLGGR